MTNRRRNIKTISSVLEIIIGIALFASGSFGMIDSYWSGMGGGLIAVGIMFLFKQLKYKRNPEYKEQVDTATNDERNKYLGMKAWSWTGYATVIILAAASIGCKVAGQDLISTLLGGIVCLMVVLYWPIYVFLSKKY